MLADSRLINCVPREFDLKLGLLADDCEELCFFLELFFARDTAAAFGRKQNVDSATLSSDLPKG